MGKTRISDRQELLNRYYGSRIVKILSEPTAECCQCSDVSYAEAKKILKHTMHQLKKMPVKFQV
jgi:hypothetical protein